MMLLMFLCQCLVLILLVVTSLIEAECIKCTGDNSCCCTEDFTKATCDPVNGTRRTYIPKLPETVNYLVFTRNNIPEVTRDTFRNITDLNLQILDFSANNVTSVSTDAFQDLVHLIQLDLGSNSDVNKTELSVALTSLNKSNFRRLVLRSIGLESTDVVSKMNGFRFSILNLVSNKITDLKLTDFVSFTVAHLVLRGNLLESSCEDPSKVYLNYLTELALSNNRLIDVPKYLCEGRKTFVPILEELDLSNNAIISIDKDRLQCLKSLQCLRLTGNPLRKILPNTFVRLSSLESLYLNNMAWNIGIDIQPSSFTSSSLAKLWLDGNNVKFNDLPTREELFKYCPNLILLNIDSNSFKGMGDADIVSFLSPLVHIETLSMVSVDLKRIPSGLLDQFKNLSDLKLDRNQISSIGETFSTISTLSSLSLAENFIDSITENTFPSKLLMNLTSINLSKNPFDCSCNLLWFRNQIGKGKKLGNATIIDWPLYYHCATPSTMKNKLLKEFSMTKKSCGASKWNLIMVIAVAAGSCCVLFVLVAILINRNIWHFRYLIFKLKRIRSVSEEHQPLLGTTQKAYDAYVIYNMEDRGFVHGHLIDYLEHTYDYRMYVWHRDTTVDNGTLDVMVEAMYASRTVIAVMSDNFLGDDSCNFQLMVAMNRNSGRTTEHVLFVMLETLNVERLSKDLCVMLAKNKKTEWCGDPADPRRQVFEQHIMKLLGD